MPTRCSVTGAPGAGCLGSPTRLTDEFDAVNDAFHLPASLWSVVASTTSGRRQFQVITTRPPCYRRRL